MRAGQATRMCPCAPATDASAAPSIYSARHPCRVLAPVGWPTRRSPRHGSRVRTARACHARPATLCRRA
eukprot:5402382-Alexandrium_andersonii.AAC.1